MSETQQAKMRESEKTSREESRAETSAPTILCMYHVYYNIYCYHIHIMYRSSVHGTYYSIHGKHGRNGNMSHHWCGWTILY